MGNYILRCWEVMVVLYGYNGYFEANIRLKSDNMKFAEISSTFSTYNLMDMYTECDICTCDINLIHFLCTLQYSKFSFAALRGQEMGWRHKPGHMV